MLSESGWTRDELNTLFAGASCAYEPVYYGPSELTSMGLYGDTWICPKTYRLQRPLHYYYAISPFSEEKGVTEILT